MGKFDARRIVFGALLAAVYFALTYLLAPLSYGMIQVRVSEALTILPIFMWESIPALFIGCLLANLLGPFGMLDIVVGSLCSLVAAALTYALRKRGAVIALLPPVVCNAVGVGIVLSIVTSTPFLINALWVGVGQLISVYGLGLPLAGALRKSSVFNKLLRL